PGRGQAEHRPADGDPRGERALAGGQVGPDSGGERADGPAAEAQRDRPRLRGRLQRAPGGPRDRRRRPAADSALAGEERPRQRRLERIGSQKTGRTINADRKHDSEKKEQETGERDRAGFQSILSIL